MEEGTIFSVVEMWDDDRAADGEAVVVLSADWGGFVEVTSRVKEFVAIDVKRVAMKGVRSAGHLVGYSTLSQAILRGEGRAFHANLVHHVERRIEAGLVALSLSLGNGNAVEDDLALKIHAAVDAFGETASLDARG